MGISKAASVRMERHRIGGGEELRASTMEMATRVQLRRYDGNASGDFLGKEREAWRRTQQRELDGGGGKGRGSMVAMYLTGEGR